MDFVPSIKSYILLLLVTQRGCVTFVGIAENLSLWAVAFTHTRVILNSMSQLTSVRVSVTKHNQRII